MLTICFTCFQPFRIGGVKVYDKNVSRNEIVMDMDGWGSQAKKQNTYLRVIESEPVQFTGIKLFYKNDLKPPSTGMLTTTQVLNLTPTPIYIQYQ